MTGRQTSEYRALLDDVIAAPQDDVPRLLFADWCEDNGQGERAEFVRVQVSPCPVMTGLRGDGRPSPRRCGSCPLCRRASELLHAMIPYVDEYGRAGNTWAMYAWAPRWLWRYNADQWEYRRGFIWKARATLGDLIDVGASLFREHPVESLAVSDKDADHEEDNRYHRYVGAADLDSSRDALPIDLFDALDGYVNQYGFACEKSYLSRRDADDALSRAIIAQLRKQVGLDAARSAPSC